MRVTLDSTSRVVDIVVNTVAVPARVWEGETDTGIRVVALITRIAVRKTADQAPFDHELLSQADPTPAAVEAFPLRLVL